MNYEFFGNVFRTIMEAEVVASQVEDKNFAANVEKAKMSMLTWFGKHFPAKVEDVISYPKFNCKSFFGILAEFPELVVGHERKFFSFVSSVAKYANSEGRKNKKFQVDHRVVKIMASPYVDEYLWTTLIRSSDPSPFIGAVEAIIPLLVRETVCKEESRLKEEMFPSWSQAYPEIGVAMKLARQQREMMMGECYF